MAEKVAGLRLFSDAEGKMNLGLDEVGGGVLVISQFTLYGDAAKGRRPRSSMPPGRRWPSRSTSASSPRCAAAELEVATGEFGADMLVEIHNDGPVTLILERNA